MMSTMEWVWLLLVFLAAMGLVLGLGSTWAQQATAGERRIGQRLLGLRPRRAELPAGESLLRRRMLSTSPLLERWLARVPGVRVFDRFLLQTGLPLTVAQSLAWGLGLLLGAVLLAAGLGLPVGWCGLLGALAVLAGLAWLRHRQQQRLRRIDTQLPDALELMARSMQAGHAFSSALWIAATELKPPLAQELRTVFDEIHYGIHTQAAMTSLSERVNSPDLRFFVVAVLMHQETGGNLSQVLLSTAALVRERQKIAGVIRVLSAEGRVSALVLSALPFVVAAGMSLVSRDLLSVLWLEEAGRWLSVSSLGLMLLGIVWMWRLVRIRV
jgi:tight adherence protein B